ncbi:MAG: hypothetical protein ACYDAN_05435 [Candidatus Limnocylindrales bacterium]
MPVCMRCGVIPDASVHYDPRCGEMHGDHTLMGEFCGSDPTHGADAVPPEVPPAQQPLPPEGGDVQIPHGGPE